MPYILKAKSLHSVVLTHNLSYRSSVEMFELITIYYTQGYVLLKLPLCRLRSGIIEKKLSLVPETYINRMSLKFSNKLKGWFIVDTRYGNEI